MITFCIPTWNRAEKLRSCVESIAAQNPSAIVICDDASTDSTPVVARELERKYPFVRYVRHEDRSNFTGNFKRAVLESETEYTWTFGDDDLLMPSALSFVQGVVKNTNFDFYHVAETTRIGKAEAMCGSVLQICNAIGFLDFLGFISGNIARTPLYKRAVNSEHWEVYGKSAFPQCLGILEAMHNRPAMMLELGCVQSSDSNDADTLKRWADNNICWRYVYIAEGLRILKEKGVIPSTVPEVFFRYGPESLIGRLMSDFIANTVTKPNAITSDDWGCMKTMASMVEGTRGSRLVNWVCEIEALAMKNRQVFIESIVAYEKLKTASAGMQIPVYPVPYLPIEEPLEEAA